MDEALEALTREMEQAAETAVEGFTTKEPEWHGGQPWPEWLRLASGRYFSTYAQGLPKAEGANVYTESTPEAAVAAFLANWRSVERRPRKFLLWRSKPEMVETPSGYFVRARLLLV